MKKDYFLGHSPEGFHRVAFTEWGSPNKDKAPIVCVHGLTRNGRDFDSLAYFLSQQNLQVFCPDVVGRGDSDWLKSPAHYTYEQYLADMTSMIARTNAHSVDWIGTSMGGLIGMFLASVPNSPIKRLVLNDVGPLIPTQGLMRLAQYAGKNPVFASIEEAKRYYKIIYADFGIQNETDWQHFTETSLKEISPGHFVSKVDPRVSLSSTKSKLAWQAIMHPLKALEGTLFDVDLWAVWRNVRCPVLVIHGERSDILISTTIQKMRSTHADVEVASIANVGHAPALLSSEQHEIIFRWLNNH